MDKQPVGQLPDLTQSNNDDEIMVITNSEYNQLKKEKISDFITDLTSTNENNALTKGTDGKMFVTDFGNASNITEGTLPTSVLPEIPLEKIPDIPKDKLPSIEITDLPNSGVTAGEYIYPTNMQVNSKGQIVSVENGVTADITKEQIDTVAARPLSDNACTQEKFPDEYSYWVDQAHSTFDLSKFKVVGSPTISEDGIASNFNGQSYVSLPELLSLDVESFEVKIKFSTSSDMSNQQYIFNSNGNINGVRIGFAGNYWQFVVPTQDNTTINKGDVNTLLAVNTDYYAIVERKNNIYNFKVSLNNKDWTTIYSVEGEDKPKANTQLWQIGAYSGGNPFKGNIDLKYFQIIKDGEIVVDGRKTAIDTIIAPDYTVEGSPTISADGIANGFRDSAGYIKKSITLDFSKDVIIRGKLTRDDNTSQGFFLSLGDSPCALQIGESGRAIWYTSTGYYELTPDGIKPNTTYDFEISSSTVKIGDFVVNSGLSGASNSFDRLIIGNSNREGYSIGYTGTIDLNSFKIYSNGSLIYQPCLYIPYTETTDGTKIVDAAYFDRVQSCREQTGQALYLTLDEQEQQYYLPQGTVSGMISQNKQGLKELDAKIEQIKAQIGFTLFDTKITDHVLSGNDAVGWALQGSLVTNIYTDAVSNIASAYASGTDTTYREISCKRATDGRYIADIAQKEAIDELFENTGIADFYILDSANNQFYLPKSKWFMQLTADTDTLNQYNESALPNITGAFNANQLFDGAAYGSGAFQAGGANGYPTPNSNSDASQSGFNFNASRSSSVYKTGQEYVQPPSSNKLLYYKVGDTLTNDTAIDIGNMSNIISDLSEKTQIDEFVVSGNTWYRKYSNGFVEQAGLATGLSSNTSTINLPVSMANTNYTILLSLAGITGGSSKNVGGTRSSSSSFTLYAETAERNAGIFWYIAGQGA